MTGLSVPAVIRFTGITAVAVVLALLLGRTRLVRQLEDQLDDFWYTLHSQTRTEDRIAVIEIDDATLEHFFPEIPLPRNQIALLLDYLVGPIGEAKTVAIDLYFEGPDKFNTMHDTLLAVILGLHQDKIVNAMYLLQNEAGTLYRDTDRKALLAPFSYHVTGLSFPRADNANLPLDLFLESSRFYGHINILGSASLVYRQVPLFVEADSAIIGCMALEAIRSYQDIPKDETMYTQNGVSCGAYEIPVDSRGVCEIRYFRNSGYERYSMLDIMERFIAGEIPNGIFKNKIVIVGVNSQQFYPKEISQTPYGDTRANLYLHADLISNILNGFYLRPVSVLVPLAVGLGVVLFHLLVILIPRRMIRLVGSLAALVGVFLIDFVLFQYGFLFNSIALGAMTLILGVTTGFSTFREQDRIIVEQARQVSELKEKEQSLLAIEKELKVARAIQENLLPREIPRLNGCDLYAVNLPARNVSGDLYDFILLDEHRLVLTLGDVTGKGISAAMLMAATQAVIRSEVQQYADRRPFPCGELVATVNKLICASSDPGNFVTLFFAVLDTADKSLAFVNAGHNDPVLVSADGSTEQLHTGGLLVGAFPDVPYTENSVALGSGQKLVIFTDGVTEAEDAEQQMYGEERLGKVIEENRHRSAEQLAGAIIDDVTEFAGGNTQSDDITLLVAGVRDGGK